MCVLLTGVPACACARACVRACEYAHVMGFLLFFKLTKLLQSQRGAEGRVAPAGVSPLTGASGGDDGGSDDAEGMCKADFNAFLVGEGAR